ncbi:NAD-dependent epimerase/dehydratase family protein [Cupriavidus necator]|uniref:NAD-dependent epimerase/dehydratase family protein n=1 Tax=Cupriavidus necator TaxID=106590 RepID=UPI0005B51FF1|nr:NAD-dependent epimerase/dehydratase family protein [Cupriavidus necator]
MRVLVTGASGFLGRHVVAQLRASGADVIALSRQPRVSMHGEVCTTLMRPDDAVEVVRVVEQAAPQLILHLAGLSSATTVAELYVANAVFASHLLDAAAALKPSPTVVLAGSAAEYGPVQDAELPVSESYACRPVSSYGISKYAQTLHGLAAASRGLPVVVARIFNPIGPGMSATLALGSFARQVAGIGDTGGVLRTGDLDVERDFIEAGEAARLLIGLGGVAGASGEVVNICTGRGWNLGDVTRRLIELSGVPIHLEFDIARKGNSTFSRFCGDPAKLKRLGFEPALPDMDAVLAAMLADARSQLDVVPAP